MKGKEQIVTKEREKKYEGNNNFEKSDHAPGTVKQNDVSKEMIDLQSNIIQGSFPLSKERLSSMGWGSKGYIGAGFP